MGQGGELVWANPKMLSFPDEVRERVCGLCEETFSWATGEEAGGPAHQRGRRFSVPTSDGRYLQKFCPPSQLLEYEGFPLEFLDY